MRGLWFLSEYYEEATSTAYIGFRPLAGIMVLIAARVRKYRKKKKALFPSPCGDYGSYLPMAVYGCFSGIISFRPLAGIMVLIKDTATHYYLAYIRVSVPLRGLWFLSPTQSFRGYYQSGFLSVPLRGLWFLSGMKVRFTFKA